MKISKKILTLVLCLMITLSTCLYFGCNKKKSSNVIQLNEVTHSIFYAPLYVAINNGYFKDEGLEIELTNGGGSDTSMTALLTGNADIVLVGPETAIYTEQEGIKDKTMVFGQLTHCDGSFIVSKEEKTSFSLNDLVGETIIGGRAGGMPAMTLQYIIENNGFTIGNGSDKINLRDDVAFNLIGSVFQGDSSIEYCTLFEPTATNLEKEGYGHVVTSVGSLLSKDVPYTCFVAKSSFLKKEEKKAEKFLKAVQKGYEYIATHTAEEVANVLLKSFEGNTVEELAVAVEAYLEIGAWTENFAMTEESFNTLQDIMLNAGVITERSQFNKVVDNSIANKIKD